MGSLPLGEPDPARSRERSRAPCRAISAGGGSRDARENWPPHGEAMSRTYRTHTRQRVALAALVAACVMVVTLDFRQNEGGPIRRLQNAAVAVVAPLQQGVTKVF